ncbi:MAG: hypothetical protein JWR69_2487 [Pedosphaera sp.]|nr:hypothetical protein [Pedosphaera sp.]
MKVLYRLSFVVLLALPLTSANSQVPDAPALQGPVGATPGENAVAAPASVSPGAAEVIKLAESGSSDDVLLAFITNSRSTYELSADAVIYLKDVGLSAPVVTAMLNHDSTLRGQAPAYTYDQKAYPPSGQPPVAQPPIVAAVPEQPAPPQPVEAAPTYVSNPPAQVNYFYNDLSPYGSWVQLDGYGWCWQPRTVVVSRGWRPYCDGGHWVYTDAGWFWQSDYSWGWATFHYGRWQLHDRCGWIWLPDTVWAPAWVSWRVSGDHCGWAPLPPHADFDARLGFRFNGVSVRADFDFGLRADNFTFVALRDFNNRDLGHHRLPPTQVKAVYNQTTIINSYEVHNNVIVNHGVGVDRVAAATHSEIKKVVIRDGPANSGRPVRSIAPGRSETAVYRPQLQTPAKSIGMVAQKVDDRHPVVQHNVMVKPQPQRNTPPGNGGSSPASNPRRSQTGAADLPQRTIREKPESNVPNRTTPDARQPANGGVPGRSINEHREEAKPSANTGESYRPATPVHSQSPQSPGQPQPDAGQQKSQGHNPHVYYPARYPQPSSAPQGHQNQESPTSRPDNGRGSQNKKDGF